MLIKIQIFITIGIEPQDDGTFDVVLKRSSIPTIHGELTRESDPTEFRRRNLLTRTEAEIEAERQKDFFDKIN